MFEDSLLDSIREKLLSGNTSVAVAESVTSGFLQAAFSTAKDAIKFYQGGITTYNLGQKTKHLSVDPIHAQNCNCVSEQVAESMARNVAKTFISHYGIGICGYCTAGPESGNRMFAYYAIVKDGLLLASGIIGSDAKEGAPVQLDYVNQVLDKFERVV